MPDATGSKPTVESSRINPWDRPGRYKVSVDEYLRFNRDGFLVVRGLVRPAEIAELKTHT